MRTIDKGYLVLSSILFALMTYFIKLASVYVPGNELLFFRFIGGIVICLIVDKNCFRFSEGSFNIIFFRALYGTIATLGFFYAPYFIPISRLSVLHFSYPMFEVIFSIFWIKEKPEKIIYFSLPLSIFGIFYIMNPSFSGLNIGDLLGLISGIFAGIAVIAIRKARIKNSTTTIFLYFSVFGAIVTCIINFFQWVTPSFYASFLILLVAVTGGLGQVAMTYAYKSSGVGEGSVISLLTVVFINILGFIFLKEPITYRLIFGEFLVMSSIVLLIVKRTRDIYLE
ncbi:MAG: DMT family transporter [Candidatus Firestonebacteria bacterium]|nr:DMT family transporter [Candidatus Firestonebacteria bacterium]